MLHTIFLAFLCHLACSYIFVIAEASENEGRVKHYTSDTFPSEITRSNHFVMFYAPWCAHCKRLMPVWDQLAEMLNDDKNYQLTIAKVDCISDNSLCTEHDVTGYPTLKFFKMGISEGVKFRGTRDLTSLTSFINDQLGTPAPDRVDSPPVKVNGMTELTDSSFYDFIQKGSYFIEFYAPWCGYCQAEKPLPQMKTTNDLDMFLLAKMGSFICVEPYWHQNYGRSTETVDDKFAPTWEDLAKSLANDPSVEIGKVDCTIHKVVCNKLDIKGYPTLLWIQDGKVVEKYQGQRTEPELKYFIKKMLGNKVPRAKEEAVVDSGRILILNGENFHEGIAHGVSFVKFFAPWCAYCKRLAPTWNELSKKLIGIPNVRLIKVDCTLDNSKELCNEQEVEGFPTLYLYKNGRKVAEYNGSRNVEDLYEFVAKYFTHDEL